jgi:glycosyltransferase involved in cell wall biosynthesis
MPAYQSAASIGAAVSSVLSQTYDDLELVVVDDGSTDETAAIARSHGDRVKVISQPNGGPAAARNRGMQEARGELIAFCDADDIFFPEHISTLVATFDAHGGIATGNAWWLYPGGIEAGRTRIRGRFPSPQQQRRAILERNFVCTMSLFTRAMVDDIGPMTADLQPVEDWDFWMRAIFAGYRISLRSRPLALYRWSMSGLSSDPDRMEARTKEVLRRLADRPGLTADERAYVERRLSGPEPHTLARRADAAVEQGRYRDASRDYRRAAELCPTERPLVWKSRVLSVAPAIVGPVLRSRHERRQRRLGAWRR